MRIELGSHERVTATISLRLPHYVGEAEIRQLELVRSIMQLVQDVRRFDVAMDYIVGREIVKRLKHVVKEVVYIFLGGVYIVKMASCR